MNETALIAIGDKTAIVLPNVRAWRIDESRENVFDGYRVFDGHRMFDQHVTTIAMRRLTIEISSVSGITTEGEIELLSRIIKSKLTVAEVLAIAEEMVAERRVSK